MADLKTVVAATTNEHKLAEIAATLGPYGYTIVSREAAGVPEFEIEETGETFEENSLIKAQAIFDWLEGRVATLADDSGIEADALGGAPGVYSARFAGPLDEADFAAARDNGDGSVCLVAFCSVGSSDKTNRTVPIVSRGREVCFV